MIGKPLKPFGRFCVTIGELPSSYMESLSYLEMLSWLCNYIEKTVIPAINENAEAVKEIQEFLEKYQDQYDEVKQMMEELIISINQRFSEIEQELTVKFNQLTNQVLELIDNNYNLLKNYIDGKYEELDYKINHISIDSIELRDPTTGTYNNIQVVIDNVFNTFNVDALTASEYDALELTATSYDTYDITAYDYDTKAKTLLV